jgi:hypothetical protein
MKLLNIPSLDNRTRIVYIDECNFKGDSYKTIHVEVETICCKGTCFKHTHWRKIKELECDWDEFRYTTRKFNSIDQAKEWINTERIRLEKIKQFKSETKIIYYP